MALKDDVMTALKAAMKAQDQDQLRTLRSLKAAIQNVETAEGFGGWDDAAELKLLQKQAKQRRDSIEQFEANGRTDLAATEKAELKVIETFLPAQLSEQELAAEVAKLIEGAAAEGPPAFGTLMKAAQQQLAGRVDGKALAAELKRQLNV